MVKNLPSSAGDKALVPGSERPHMSWEHLSLFATTLKPVSRAGELQLLSACATTAEALVLQSPCYATSLCNMSECCN